MSLLWRTASVDPAEEFNQRVDEENAKPGKEFASATDECKHCGRRLLFDPTYEVYLAKGHEGYDCPVNGSFSHEPD